MNKLCTFLVGILFSIFFTPLYAQNGSVAIGSNDPHPSALLELKSSSKGFLPPRLTAVERRNISSPAAGLVVYDTDANLLYMFDGYVWKPLATISEKSLARSVVDSTGTIRSTV